MFLKTFPKLQLTANVKIQQKLKYIKVRHTAQKITKKLGIKILSATPKADVLQETSCTSLQDRQGMLFVKLIQLSPHFNCFLHRHCCSK